MEDPRSHAQTFERCAGPILNECLAIATERGAQYADSWSLENSRFALARAFLARLGMKLDDAEMRLLGAYVMCDVKLSRITSGGPHKRDSYVDLLNYMALVCTLREEFEEEARPVPLAPAV